MILIIRTMDSSAEESSQEAQGNLPQHASLTKNAKGGGAEEDEEDAGERLARSRERNREHARRTRLRKKAQLQALQSRVKELQEESRLLKQTVEECSIASILLGLSGTQQDQDDDLSSDIGDLMGPRNNDPAVFCATPGGKRKRFLSDADQTPQPMQLKIKGKLTTVGGAGTGRTQINWKSGVYFDEDGVQQQLTPEELEDLRRERNRMHAKMTRDRKKNFISTIEKTIAHLERDNKRMRETLEKQANHQVSKGNTPTPSPLISAVPSPSSAALIAPEISLPAQISADNSPAPSPTPAPKNYISVEKLTAALAPPRKISKISDTSVIHGFKVVA